MVEIINQYDDIYSDPPVRIRESARALVVREGKILLTHELNTGVYMSPGGGIENGETLEECCVRELKEETGYVVRPIERFVTVKEHSVDTLYVSNYFICEVTGECEKCLTETEVEHGAVPEWLEVSQAVELFATYGEKRYDVMSLYLRDYLLINRLI